MDTNRLLTRLTWKFCATRAWEKKGRVYLEFPGEQIVSYSLQEAYELLSEAEL